MFKKKKKVTSQFRIDVYDNKKFGCSYNGSDFELLNAFCTILDQRPELMAIIKSCIAKVEEVQSENEVDSMIDDLLKINVN